MTWNYRVVHRMHGEEDVYAVHEVYYRSEIQDEVEGMTVNKVGPSGDNLEELALDLRRMLRALDMPVLEFDGMTTGHRLAE